MKLRVFLCIVTILSALGFSSCNQLFESFQEESNYDSSTTQLSGTNQQVQITVSLPNDINLNTSDDNSRSAMASFSTLKYKAVATTSGLSTVTKTSDTSSIGISLTAGHTWTITVGAYSDATYTTLVLQGSKTVSVTGPLAETIPLSVYTGTDAATGNINLACTIDGNIADQYRYALDSSLSGSASVIGDSKVTISKDNVTPGKHTLIIQFFNNGYLVYCLSTDITVYPTLTTATWILEEGAGEYNGVSTFTLTSDLINTQRSSTFYVCGESPSIYGKTITSVSSGNDSSLGTVLSPLETVSKAVSKCSFTTNPCTIFVDGTVTEAGAIAINNTRNITIKSLGTSATIKRDSTNTSSMITVASGGTLTMKNITLDGNTTSCSVEGTGINTSGTTTLADCVIQNCVTTSNGGGIYIQSGSVTLTDSIIGKSVSGLKDGTQVTVEEAAKSTDAGNIATNGAGIYIKTGTLTLAGASEISYNYSSSNGGAIYIAGGTVNIGSETDNTPQVYANRTDYRGSIYASSGILNIYGKIHHNYGENSSGIELGEIAEDATCSLNIYSGSSICDNQPGTNFPGGVHVANSGESSIITMTGGTISNNTRNDNASTSDVKILTGTTFKLSGDSKIGIVWLVDTGKITIAGNLTGTTPVATILPNSYAIGTEVLVGDYVSTEYYKIDLVDGDYLINSVGTIQNKILERYNKSAVPKHPII